MKDVAKRAGVSQTTVSLVFNQVPDSNIPQETQDRVWAAVEELAYRPHATARSLRSGRSQTIGFVSDEIATSPYAGRMIQGAQDIAWSRGKILLLVNTGGDSAMEEAAVEMMLDRQVEGIIYATMYHRMVQPPKSMPEVPVVLADCYCQDQSLPSVVPDEAQGGRDATKALLEKGHRRVGFVNNVNRIPATIGRLQGYQEALAAFDIPFDETLVVEEEDFSGGYKGTLELMRLPDPPTAIFCFNDGMAMGAYDALRKLDLSIPNDVAVIGFDNHEIIASHLYPPLSTMQLPHCEMGAWAARFLIDQIDGSDDLGLIQHRAECAFIERSSL